MQGLFSSKCGCICCCLKSWRHSELGICYCLFPHGSEAQTSVFLLLSLWMGDLERVYLLVSHWRCLRLRTSVSVAASPVVGRRLRMVVSVAAFPVTGQRLRTRSIFRNGTFIPFLWGGDRNLALLHFRAVIGCFHQSGGHGVSHPSFLLLLHPRS